MVLVKFAVQLIDLLRGFAESLFARNCNFVQPSPTPLHLAEGGLEQAGALQTVEQRVESAGADPITMMRKFFHHRHPEDGFVRGMDEHVNANEPVKELPALIRHRI